MEQVKKEGMSLWSNLWDFSFTEFMTLKIVKFLYVLAIIGAGLVGLGIIGEGLASHSGLKVITSLILGPVVFLACVLGARLWLEMTVVIFRIAENTNKLVKLNSTE